VTELTRQASKFEGLIRRELAARIKNNKVAKAAAQTYSQTLEHMALALPEDQQELVRTLDHAHASIVIEAEHESYLYGFQHGQELAGIVSEHHIPAFSEEWHWLLLGSLLTQKQRQRIEGRIEGMIEIANEKVMHLRKYRNTMQG
jgi:hypothetical protein